METPKIIFIVSGLAQARCIKRIISLKNAGYNVEVYGYDRHGLTIHNTLPDNIAVHHLGSRNDGKDYFHKLWSGIRDTLNIIKSNRQDTTIFYAFGMVYAGILTICRKKTVYEISDIAYGYPKFKLLLPFLKQVDKYIIKRSLLTVLTSEGFSRFFFKTPPSNIIIQPNKLNSIFLATKRPEPVPPGASLSFGFVGLIRYPDTMFRFARIIGEKFPQHQFHFYGDCEMRDYCCQMAKQYNNIKFWGPFKNPENLEAIYKTIDIVVACYHTKSYNERILEPNKLYEAIYFNKPIVVSKNTFLADQVKYFNCGYAINAYDDNEIISFISSLSSEKIFQIATQCNQIDDKELIDSPDNIINYLKNNYR